MIERLLRLADKPVRAIMTPRTEIAWIDRTDSPKEIAAALKATPLLFAPLFVWQRRWTALATMLAVIVLLSVIPDLLYPAPDGTSDRYGANTSCPASTSAACRSAYSARIRRTCRA